MKNYPSVRDPGSIEQLFTKIISIDPPASVDRDFLTSLGFRRGADGALVELLCFLGLINVNGEPTDLWLGPLRTGDTPQVLGRAVKAGYSELFSTLPEALSVDGSVLMEFFRKSTGASDPEVAYMILTFKVLSDISVFPDDEPESVSVSPPEPVEVPEKTSSPPVETPEAQVTVTGTLDGGPSEGTCAPVIRLSIHIDVSGDSDPQIRELAHRLLKKQLDSGRN